MAVFKRNVHLGTNDPLVETDDVADKAVTTEKIDNGAITTEKIDNGAITTEKIADGAIDANEIASGAVTSSKIADGAVTTNKLEDEAVRSQHIKYGAVTTEKIADGDITEEKIANGAVTNSKIANGTLTSAVFADNTITGDKIMDNSVPGSKLQDGTIESVDIKDNSLSGAKLVDNSVTGAKLADNAIESRHLQNNSIPAEKIKDGTIESIDIKDGTLSGTKIKDGTIESAKLSDGAITNEKIVNNAITTAKLDDNAVTSAKIAGSAVTEGKIAANAVTEDKIANSAISTAKIADNAVTETKIATGAVTATKIPDNTITEGKIANEAITTGKISDNAITEDKLADGAVTTAKLADGMIQQIQTITDAEPIAGSVKPVQSGGVQNELALGAVYDVSAKNPTAGLNNDGKWESLSALLSDANLNTLIPTNIRRGGMSIKFVSDNKYVQYRLMLSEFTDAQFTNVANWQGVDDEPTYRSNNLVKSGGVYSNTVKARWCEGKETEFNVADENGNVVLKVANGEIITKEFSSNGISFKNADIDWAITDKNGNAVLEIRKGSIKTKNFDSQLLNTLLNTVKNKEIDFSTEVIDVVSKNLGLVYNNYSQLGNFDFDFKWVGGCLANNGRIYGIVNGNRQAVEINPVTNTYTLFGKTSEGAFKWTGCGVGNNGFIYGFPRSANSVLIINPDNLAIVEQPINTNYGQDHHYGGCLVGNKIYLAPRTANHILVIDINDWSTYTLGSNILTTTTRYSAVCYHPNGYIYFIPERNAKLIKLNPNTDELVEIGETIDSCSVYGVAIAPNNLCMYGFTGYRNAGKIMKINPENNDEMTWIGEGVGTGYYGCKLGLNGRIYPILGNSTILWELNPIDDSVTQIGTIDDSVGGNYNEAKCAGGVLTEDGSIYMIPAKGRHIYKLSFSGMVEQTLSRKVLSSSFFSNY